MPAYTLIPVDETNLDELLALYRQCEDFLALGPRPHASPGMVLEDLEISRKNGGQFFGVYINGEIAGVFDAIPGGLGGAPHTAYLEMLMIGQKFRNQGLGEKIVRDYKRELICAGVKILEADVQVNNPDGIRFWQRMGFQVVSEPRPQPDGTTSVHLFQELSPG